MTNIPREASICFNCQIALSAVAVLLACSICRRSAFSEGSLSLIVHRHTNTLASWKLAIQTLCLTPGKRASKEFVYGRDIFPTSRTKSGMNYTANDGAASLCEFLPRVKPKPPGPEPFGKGIQSPGSGCSTGELAIVFEPSVNGKRLSSNRLDVNNGPTATRC